MTCFRHIFIKKTAIKAVSLYYKLSANLCKKSCAFDIIVLTLKLPLSFNLFTANSEVSTV